MTQWSANLFADDVVLIANSAESLQAELDICTEWAAEFCFIWAQGKSYVITPSDCEKTFCLSQAVLKKEEKATYLGVDIGLTGVQESRDQKLESQTSVHSV